MIAFYYKNKYFIPIDYIQFSKGKKNEIYQNVNTKYL
jgi:hypothetical protein